MLSKIYNPVSYETVSRKLNEKDRFNRILTAIKTGDSTVHPQVVSYISINYCKEQVVDYLKSLDPGTINHSEDAIIMCEQREIKKSTTLLSSIVNFFYNKKLKDGILLNGDLDKCSEYLKILINKGAEFSIPKEFPFDNDYYRAKELGIDLYYLNENIAPENMKKLEEDIGRREKELHNLKDKYTQYTNSLTLYERSKLEYNIINCREKLGNSMDTLQVQCKKLHNLHEEHATITALYKRSVEDEVTKKELGPIYQNITTSFGLINTELSKVQNINKILKLNIQKLNIDNENCGMISCHEIDNAVKNYNIDNLKKFLSEKFWCDFEEGSFAIHKYLAQARTPLSNDDIEAVILLLKHGAEASGVDENQKTVLHYCTRKIDNNSLWLGHMFYRLDTGNLTKVDADDKTPFDLIKENKEMANSYLARIWETTHNNGNILSF